MGIRPTNSRGIDAQGAPPNELMTIRRAAARAGGISKRGCNIDMVWALNPRMTPSILLVRL
eukprot:7904752-Pyramimonas_sp.AAC.1